MATKLSITEVTPRVAAPVAIPLAAAPTPRETPVAKLAKPPVGALLAFVSQGVSSATNFLRLVFIVRVCTEAEVGVYALGMTIVLLAMALHERLVESPYTVFAHRTRDESGRQLLGATMLLSLAANAAASCLVAGAGAVVWIAYSGSDVGLMLVVVGLAMPAMVMRELARSAAFTHFRMATALAIDVATLLLQAGLLAALWWGDRVSVTTLYCAIGLSSLIPLVGWIAAWRGDWSIVRSAIGADWSQLWSFSRWLLAARLMGNASRMIIPWIVFAILGKGEAGLLATCVSLVGLAWLFVRGVNNYFRPYIVKSYCDGGPAATRRAVAQTALVFTALIAPICALFAFGGDFLLVQVYGDKLAGAGLVVFILALNTLATSWAIAGGNGLMAIDRPRDTLWSEGLTLLATLVAAPGMISAWGLAGAAGAMLFGNVVGAVATGWLFERGVARASEEAPSYA